MQSLADEAQRAQNNSNLVLFLPCVLYAWPITATPAFVADFILPSTYNRAGRFTSENQP